MFMRFFKKLFGLSKPSEYSDNFAKAAATLDRKRLSHAFERPPSFSVLIFQGHAGTHIPELLEACNYQIVRVGKAHGSVTSLHSQMGMPRVPNNSIVYKGYFSIPGFTVLLEPEMVLLTWGEALAQFCRRFETKILIGIWERVSETAAIVEFDRNGLTRRTWYCQGSPSEQPEQQINPRSALMARPDSEGLKLALKESGIPVEQVFREVEITAYELTQKVTH